MSTRAPLGRARGAGRRPARLLLLALAALCAIAGALAIRRDDRCQAVLERARTLTPVRVRAEGPLLARAAVERCDSASEAVVALSYVAIVGDRTAAVARTRALTRRQPEDYRAWLTLGRLEGDPVRAREALLRAHALNPRGVPRPR